MVDEEQNRARKALGSKLKQAREVANLTQSEVAEAAGVHVNFYARVERGEENPSFEKLRSIMIVLRIESLELK